MSEISAVRIIDIDEADALNRYICKVWPRMASLTPYGPDTWWRFSPDDEEPGKLIPHYGKSVTFSEDDRPGTVCFYNPLTREFCLRACDIPLAKDRIANAKKAATKMDAFTQTVSRKSLSKEEILREFRRSYTQQIFTEPILLPLKKQITALTGITEA